MILDKTNITDNRKTRNKNKNQSYSTVVKGITKKVTILTSPPLLSCDTLVCDNSSDQTEFVKESPGCYLISAWFLEIFKINHTLIIILSHLMNQELEVIFVSTFFFNINKAELFRVK